MSIPALIGPCRFLKRLRIGAAFSATGVDHLASHLLRKMTIADFPCNHPPVATMETLRFGIRQTRARKEAIRTDHPAKARRRFDFFSSLGRVGWLRFSHPLHVIGFPDPDPDHPGQGIFVQPRQDRWTTKGRYGRRDQGVSHKAQPQPLSPRPKKLGAATVPLA